MIRRQVGNEYWLIAQHDHALLAGELAAQFGNKLFDAPRDRRESVLRGTSLHDCGWPLHDDHPTLNPQHQPIDVFEGNREIALKVWQASVDRALETNDDYAALLVSLHVLSLSVYATSSTEQPHEKLDLTESRTRFEVNRFQHNQIETHEKLRRKLGMRTDIPLRQGLAEGQSDPAEQLLHFHFRLLQAMDKISLALCCTVPPWDQIKEVQVRPAGRTVALNVKRVTPTQLTVSPWPFAVDSLHPAINARRLPATEFDSDESFRNAFQSAPIERIQFDLRPG
jgi:hypothetical protein